MYILHYKIKPTEHPIPSLILQVRADLLHVRYIRRIGHGRLSQPSLHLRRLLCQNMALIRPVSLKLTRSGNLKALCR